MSVSHEVDIFPRVPRLCISFFFNDTATTEIYTLSLHDALPIFLVLVGHHVLDELRRVVLGRRGRQDRKSTRLNSSHVEISYAVFCLTKKKKGGVPRIAEDDKCTSQCGQEVVCAS